MTERKKILSITLADCRVDRFRAGGKGGQNQNKRDTGVRVVHEPSGAVGESREERSQLQNTKNAFKRMAETTKFKIWLNHTIYGYRDLEAEVADDMKPENLKIEVRKDNEWTVLGQ